MNLAGEEDSRLQEKMFTPNVLRSLGGGNHDGVWFGDKEYGLLTDSPH